VARIIVLDSGPLGLACGPSKDRDEHGRFHLWLKLAVIGGARVAIPEIADYEVRRELLRSGKERSIERLDRLRSGWKLDYIPIQTNHMRKAAELWADARGRGFPTATIAGLDADVIVAAQALLYVGENDTLTLVTSNERHLSRYLDARDWRAIIP
jgi:predicted nucleic acid-binding protein